MRLKNKKTGDIWHMPKLRQPTIQEDDISFFACIGEHGCSRCELFSYKSLAELNKDWEDYTPAEPLIKDEKIRKAVRAWAEVVGKEEIFVVSYNREYHDCCIYTAGLSSTAMIDLGIDLNISEGSYTIAELCGEEEE